MIDKRPFHVHLPFSVKTYDVDFANIVHNMVYIRWLEDLRLQILDDHYPVADMLADGIGPILTKTEIDYKWPVRMGDVVNGNMWISNLGRVRWTVKAEMLVGDKLAAQATQTGYFANMNTFRPIRIPKKIQIHWDTYANM